MAHQINDYHRESKRRISLLLESLDLARNAFIDNDGPTQHRLGDIYYPASRMLQHLSDLRELTRRWPTFTQCIRRICVCGPTNPAEFATLLELEENRVQQTVDEFNASHARIRLYLIARGDVQHWIAYGRYTVAWNRSVELLWDYLESNDAIVAEDVTFVVPPPEDYPPYAGDAQVEVV